MTRTELEKKLLAEADHLGLKGARRSAYVYGPLNAVFPKRSKGKLPSLLRTQANPILPPSEKYPAGRSGGVSHKTKMKRMREDFDYQMYGLDELKKGNKTPLSKTEWKKSKRKKNPVGAPNTQTKVEHAMRLYERFRLDEPRFVDEVAAPSVDVAMVIGFLSAVEYDTKRAGKVEYYRHEFAKKSRPLLVSAWDGTQIIVLGGKYNFTKDGIVDY